MLQRRTSAARLNLLGPLAEQHRCSRRASRRRGIDCARRVLHRHRWIGGRNGAAIGSALRRLRAAACRSGTGTGEGGEVIGSRKLVIVSWQLAVGCWKNQKPEGQRNRDSSSAGSSSTRRRNRRKRSVEQEFLGSSESTSIRPMCSIQPVPHLRRFRISCSRTHHCRGGLGCGALRALTPAARANGQQLMATCCSTKKPLSCGERPRRNKW